MEGTVWTFAKGTTLSGNGLNFVAFRTASKSAVLGAGGPSTTKLSPPKTTAQAQKGAIPVLDASLAQKIANLRAAHDQSLANYTSVNSPVLPIIQTNLSNLQRALASIPR